MVRFTMRSWIVLRNPLNKRVGMRRWWFLEIMLLTSYYLS